MKNLPILTASLAALTVLAWLAWDHDAMSLWAQAVTSAQAETEEQDADQERVEEVPQAESDAALAVLRDARRKLFIRGSVQAKLRETISMGPRKFQAEGTYFAGPFPKLRLTFKIDSGGTRGELLEVCDGQILWTVQRIAVPGSAEPEERVARTVINEVREAMEETLDVPETALIFSLGVGGLPSLLAALERSMTFEAIRELESDGHKFSVIQGRWNDDYRDRLTGGQQGVELPEYVPDHVRIYFDAENSFPTRILYLKETAPESHTFTALLSLEFWDVVLDGPVSEDLFRYAPKDLTKARDRTLDFLQMIESAAEASRAESTVRPDGSVPLNEK